MTFACSVTCDENYLLQPTDCIKLGNVQHEFSLETLKLLSVQIHKTDLRQSREVPINIVIKILVLIIQTDLFNSLRTGLSFVFMEILN